MGRSRSRSKSPRRKHKSKKHKSRRDNREYSRYFQNFHQPQIQFSNNYFGCFISALEEDLVHTPQAIVP